jgi:hypothetical protein
LQFKSLLIELERVAGCVSAINLRGSELNTIVGTDDNFSKSLKKQSAIISLVEKI